MREIQSVLTLNLTSPVQCKINKRKPGHIEQDLTSKSNCIYTSLKDYQVSTIVNKRETDLEYEHINVLYNFFFHCTNVT